MLLIMACQGDPGGERDASAGADASFVGDAAMPFDGGLADAAVVGGDAARGDAAMRLDANRIEDAAPIGLDGGPVARDAGSSPVALEVEYSIGSVLVVRTIDVLFGCDRSASGANTQVRLQLDDGYTLLLLMLPPSAAVGAPLTLDAGFTPAYASWSDTSSRAPAEARRAFLPPTSSGTGTVTLTEISRGAVAGTIDNLWSDVGVSVRVRGTFECR